MPDPNGSVFGVVRPNSFSHGYMAFLPSEYDANPGKSYPLIIHLHGAGEIGDGTYNGNPTYAGAASNSQLQRVLIRGPLRQIQESGYTSLFDGSRPAIIVQPQTTNHWNSASSLRGLIDTWKARWRVDVDQIHLCGLSMGGGGVWVFAATYGSELCTAVSACPATESVTDRNMALLAGCTSWVVVAADDSTSGGLPTYAVGRKNPATQVGWAGQIARDRAGITGDPQPLNTHPNTITYNANGTFGGVVDTRSASFDDAAGWTWSTGLAQFIGKPYLFSQKRVNATLLNGGGHAGAWDQLFGTNAAPNKPFWQWMLNQKRGVAPTRYESQVSYASPGPVTAGTTVQLTATCTGPDLTAITPDTPVTWTSSPSGLVTSTGLVSVPDVSFGITANAVIDGITYTSTQFFIPIAGVPPMADVLNDVFTEAATIDLSVHVPDTGGTWAKHPNSSGVLKVDPTNDEVWCESVTGQYIHNYAGLPAQLNINVDFVNRGGTPGTPGVLFRWTKTGGTNTANTGYFLSYASTQWKLWRAAAGVFTSLGTFDQALTVGQTYSVQIQVRNANITVLVDGVSRIVSTDTAGGSAINSSAAQQTIGLRYSVAQTSTTGVRISRLTVDDLTPLGGVSGTDDPDFKVTQRNPATSNASRTLAGTYTGTPTKIQARVVTFGGGTTIVDWTDGTFATGAFSVTMTVPQGGWYQWEARSLDATDTVVDSWVGGNRWGVGMNILCIGQSNMSGYGDTVYTVADQRVALLRNGTTWERMVEPWITGFRASIGPALGNTLVAALNFPIGLIVHAPGGAGLTVPNPDYWGDRNSGNPTSTATCYGKALTYALAAGGVELVCWNQGATEAALGPVDQPTYSAALATLKANFETDLGFAAGALPWFLNQVGRRVTASGATDAGYNGIREAHRLWDNPSIKRYNVGSTLDFPIVGPDATGGTISHYGGASMVILGQRFAQAILFSLGLRPTYGGPRLATATFGSSQNKIRVNIDPNGSTDFLPTSGIQGFKVTDGSGTKVITTVSRISAGPNAFVLEITTSTICSGVTTVLYGTGWYGGGEVASMLVDNNLPSFGLISDPVVGVVVGPYVPGASGDATQPKITLNDSTGVPRTINTLNNNGRGTDTTSQPVVLPQSDIDVLKPLTDTNKEATQIQMLGRMPALNGGRVPTKDGMTTFGFKTVNTDGTDGTAFVIFADQSCTVAWLSAPSSNAIRVQKGGGGDYFLMQAGSRHQFRGLTNLNQLGVRRDDGTSTAVVVSAHWES
jgi:predicted peptidase